MVTVAAAGLEQRLIGREPDLRRAARLLDEHRLVTVTGVGGVGKTSLAKAAAHAGRRQVVFCSLGDVATGDAVRHFVAGRLGTVLPPGVSLGTAVPPPREGDGVLIVLDNCEHVLDAAALVAEEILEAGPHVRVLATSREPMGLASERALALGPLTVAGASEEVGATGPAAMLFIERARAVRDDLVLDERAQAQIDGICRALDGLPLALEIAAARVRSMSLADIADRLCEPLRFLTGAGRRGPTRHRGLRSVIAWSYDLLDEHEKAAFDHLCVYATCDLKAALDAAEAAGTPQDRALDVLDGLVAKSLLVAETSTGQTRYRMLETLRAFGAEQLREKGTSRKARDRHAHYYAVLTDGLRELGLTEWTLRLAGLITEFDNFRLALEWTLDTDDSAHRSFQLLALMWYVGLQSHSREIADLALRALSRWPEYAGSLHAEVCATISACLLAVEDTEGARRYALAAITAGTSEVASAWGHATLAGIALHRDNDPATALGHLDNADAAAKKADFEPFRCDVLGRRTSALVQSGRRSEALVNARAALSMAERQGNVFEHAWDLHLVGLLLTVEDPSTGLDWLTEALHESVASGYPYGTAASLRGLGVATAGCGDFPEAARHFSAALDEFIRAGFRLERWNTLAAMLPLFEQSGRNQLAAAVDSGIVRSGVVIEGLAAPHYSRSRGETEDSAHVEEERLLAQVRAELRTIARSAPEPPVRTPETDHETARLHRAGSLWLATYRGRTVHLPELKGLADLAVLLGRPGRETPALDLAAGDKFAMAARHSAGVGASGTAGDLGDAIDARARASYAARIRQLEQELEEADAADDPARGTRAAVELDALKRELSSAYGLHGPRRTGDPAEKARTTVTARIRAAIAKVAEVYPELGRHLQRSVRTGRFCVYEPETPVAWDVRP